MMNTQTEASPATPAVSPYLTVRNVMEAVQFYEKAFRFKVSEVKSGEDEIGLHAEMSYKGPLIMCGNEGAYGSPLKAPATSGVESPMTLCLYCDDVDEFYKTSLSQGAKSISAPEDMFWGYRMCRLQDPDGYTWCFMTPTA
jgi:PhnB protein